jgi:hypothetical protein
MRPHQIAKLPDLQLSIRLSPEIQKVQHGPQAEAHDKVLSAVER